MNSAPVTIVGNVTADPDVRVLDNGTHLAKFSVAVNHRYRKNEEWVDEASFINVVAWRYLGEDVDRVLEKGVRVVVTGRLSQRSWDDSEGNKRSSVELVADEVGLGLRSVAAFDRRRGTGGGGGGAPATAPVEEDVW